MKTFNAMCLTLMLTLATPGTGLAQDEVAETYSQAELDQMLAPIALYPDTVLSHVLIAATYPLEVIQAYRWSQDHPDLSGAEAVAAVERQDWAPSVKALVAFPEILRRMNDDLAWTQRLGEAFLLQEEEVIASVQGLRERAYTAGNLRTDEHVEVIREDNVIVVEPARPEVVYVPYYDPRVVYGPWWWSAYPPVYWSYPTGFHVGINYWWGHGYRITPSWFYISSFHWTRRHVVVINHHHHYKRPQPHFRSGRDLVRYDGARRWSHNPHHRRGAGYRAQRLNDRFTAPQRYRDADRREYRGTRGPRQRQQVDFQRPQSQAPRVDRRDRQVQERLRTREAPAFQRQAPRVDRRTPPAVERPVQRVERRETPVQVQRPAPQVQRQAPQVQRPAPQVQRQAPQVQRQAPRVERRETPVQMQRPAPQVQRQAPQVQRPAPQVERRDRQNSSVREREQDR